MATILHIETATQVCSVAIAVSGEVVQLRESSDRNSHSATITLFIGEVMQLAGLEFRELDAVAVSMGPGSYTGLRIGVSTAKGICYAVDKPLIAIGTLISMAAGMKIEMESRLKGTPSHPELFCPMIDARRMEVYSALFDPEMNPFRETKAEIINVDSFKEELEKHMVVFAGDGAGKCQKMLAKHPNAFFLDEFAPSAAYMASLAEEKFQKSEFENVAYFEPFYLKDFIPGISRVKGLGL
jgi:tRNA threonylcarbamoyladenosine biosynthesis protein TsaB